MELQVLIENAEDNTKKFDISNIVRSDICQKVN